MQVQNDIPVFLPRKATLRRLRKAFFATLLGGMTFVVRAARVFLSLS
jgi:hypothetical protein